MAKKKITLFSFGYAPPYSRSNLRSRNQLPKLLTDLGMVDAGSTYVEIGCNQGAFSKVILKHTKGTLHCIDPFTNGYCHGDPLSSANRNRQNDKKVFMNQVLQVFEPRVILREAVWTEVVDQFEDGSLAFVYEDSIHTKENVEAVLEAWWPKVKPGGILAGHDVFSPRNPYKGWGPEVRYPLQKFAYANNLVVRMIEEKTGVNWSFYIQKTERAIPW